MWCSVRQRKQLSGLRTGGLRKRGATGWGGLQAAADSGFPTAVGEVQQAKARAGPAVPLLWPLMVAEPHRWHRDTSVRAEHTGCPSTDPHQHLSPAGTRCHQLQTSPLPCRLLPTAAACPGPGRKPPLGWAASLHPPVCSNRIQGCPGVSGLARRAHL